jgi:hypothetical protein
MSQEFFICRQKLVGQSVALDRSIHQLDVEERCELGTNLVMAVNVN